MPDKEHETTDPYAGLPFPRTDLALKALRRARDLESPAIFNHSLRTYLYGRSLGERQGLQPGHDYDDELLFVGCALHDAGLSREGDGDQTFDLDGADLAARFLTDQGMAADRVEVVWDAIALHLHADLAARKRPEIALVTAGAGYDLGPDPEHPLPPATPTRSTPYSPVCTPPQCSTTRSSTRHSPNPTKPRRSPCPANSSARKPAPWPTWQQLMTQEPSWHDYDQYPPTT